MRSVFVVSFASLFCFVSVISSSVPLCLFSFFLSFDLFFLFIFHLWFFGCPSLLGFVDLFKVLSSDPASWLSISVPVRLVTEVTYLCWLIVDIDLHPLPGADEGSGDLMVAGGFHTCC